MAMPKFPKVPGLPGAFDLPEKTPEQLAPRIPWKKFAGVMNWQTGEHVAIVGTTGSGKTELLRRLVAMRAFCVIFATKPRDSTMDDLIENEGFDRYPAWKQASPTKHPRRVVWPDASSIDSAITQSKTFADAFEAIYREGAWNLFLDEGWYLTNVLGLGEQIKIYLLQARSLDISLILATQRPVSVPVEVFDQATHLFFYREADYRNLERISGISWQDARPVRHLVASLESHQFLYVNTRTGLMWRSRTPVPQDRPE